jgi:hypothetical protein
MNKKFTFRSNKKGLIVITSFIFGIVISYLISFSLSLFIINLISDLIFIQSLSDQFLSNISLILGFIFYPIINFLILNYFIFK